MAASPASKRKALNTRSRNSVTPKRRGGAESSLSEPPQKKRKYVPGGPGGGGHYVDVDGNEFPVRAIAGGSQSTGPRTRVGSHTAVNGVREPASAQADRVERSERPRRVVAQRPPPPPRQRYSSAAAVAAAVVQGDGFKPREERGWEEFHEDLDVDADLPVFSSELIDGIVKPAAPTSAPAQVEGQLTNGLHLPLDGLRGGADGSRVDGHQANGSPVDGTVSTPGALEDAINTLLPVAITPPQPMKRKPGRPPRNKDSMLKAIGTPESTPKPVPVPGPNPRERLTLPKPTFKPADPFIYFEKTTGSIDYVDRTMAHVGYQESDHFVRPEKGLVRWVEGVVEEDLDLVPAATSDGEANAAIGASGVGRVEYDMDEQDQKWLEAYNLVRREEQVEPVKPAIFEITMTKIEKEWHALEKRIPKPNPKPPQTHRPRSSSAAAVNGEPQNEEQDSKCAICDDGDCENTNAIVFCDGCDLAVHQECYGVPFIPEGQWHCRRCQLVGRGMPTCIFCPSTDGAFKQTNSSKWAHLLCAIWIPEVCLGNNTFMEPVMDVEKVPKSRWKLTCDICKQKMGACIQCGNKSCYRAFHVTCGRRAKWCLQNKSAPGSAKLESSALKAFCDRHVSNEWRESHDVDRATNEAMAFFKYHMRGRVWSDNRQSAMEISATQLPEPPVPTFEDSAQKAIAGGNKRKRGQSGKVTWRLPSGAPVIPQTLYDSLESSLQRFTVRKRKEFAADMCRYWTLKREDKRGAALIKRLQLQMETFSSMEITRRNYAGMGAAGRTRLQRRIDFAKARLREVERLRELCHLIKEREALKLHDAELLRDLANIVYFPIPPLLWPIMEKTLTLDNNGVFQSGLLKIRDTLEKRAYASVTPFSRDLGSALTSVIGMDSITDPNQIESQIVEDRATKKTLTSQDKDNRKLARRIIRAVQGALDDANHKESELCRLPYEKELLDFDQLLEKSMSSRRFSEVSVLDERPSIELPTRESAADQSNYPPAGDLMESEQLPNGVHGHDEAPNDLASTNHEATAPSIEALPNHVKQSSPQNQLTPNSSAAVPLTNGIPPADPVTSVDALAARAPSPAKPPTPPLSSHDEHRTAISAGGVPWYMEPFDPRGTTVFEERWTGREVARGMSEELSDMDEDELSGLVDGDVALDDVVAAGAGADDDADGDEGGEDSVPARAPNGSRKKNGKLKKRWRGFR